MPKIQFIAPEFQADATFIESQFEFEGDEKQGWKVKRNGQIILTLGSGYTPVESSYCGVCSTDLARQFLPYPLPQIIGHEVVGTKDGQTVVVEINASKKARGIKSPDDPYGRSSIHSHDPERLTLGINRLPGGFAPIFLAPIDGIIPLPEAIDPKLACLIEPLAAALQGLEASSIARGERVAVLGPRRLGLLIIAALVARRNQLEIDFEIIALARHPHLLKLARALGADTAVNLNTTPIEKLNKQFDLVFDTTGKPEGLEIALNLAKKVVHLKSTHGLSALGLNSITDLVVDEISLLPASEQNLKFTWPQENSCRDNYNIYVTENVNQTVLERFLPQKNHLFHRLSFEAAIATIQNNHLVNSPLNRFDLAIASNLADVDRILRPLPGQEFSLVRPRGAILLTESDNYQSRLHQQICQENLIINSSRCGDFHQAIQVLVENSTIREVLLNQFITHQYSLQNIDAAFAMAGDSSQSIKVIIKTKNSYQ
ncbi:MAG: hypothetical protein QNJ38_24520 [Prochloraceae cyanobacterium]|nr:hypothetical protein [Prochloraceae cyanobacterium]